MTINRRRALFLFPTDKMGGAERVTRTLAVEAARSGPFVHVDCFILSGRKTGSLSELEAFENVTLRYTLASRELGGILPLVLTLAKFKYELVFSSHTHLNAIASTLRGLGLLKTNRLVARESTSVFLRHFKGLGRLIPFFYKLYGHQDLIICQTRRMMDSLCQNTSFRLGQLAAVLPNPIDADRILRGQSIPPPVAIDRVPKSRKLIIWCGRLHPVKSPQRALEALRALHNKGFDSLHLVLIGNGSLMDELRALALSLGIDEFVTFTGHLDNPIPVMARGDVGLLTSDVEGFPNVILEMLAAGTKAVVTTNCAGGLSDIPAVYVSKENNATSLAKSVVKALSNECLNDDRIHTFLNMRSPQQYLLSILK